MSGNIASGYGGGIVNSGGKVNIINSTISGNTATAASGGGGIDNAGVLNISNSTVSGNTIFGGGTNGGGIWTNNLLTLTNTTVSNNTASGAGGIQHTFGITTIRNSIVAANTNNTAVPDVVGTFASGGYNFIGNVGTAIGFVSGLDITGTGAAPINPLLAPLEFNGGTLARMPRCRALR